MRHARLALMTLVLAAFAALAVAQVPAASTAKANIAAGQQLFHERCSICHGEKGDGAGTSEEGSYLERSHGPAADLTTMSVRNGGVFPATRVSDAIHAPETVRAHGTPAMPAWGDVFYGLKSNPKAYDQRVRDLTAYIESIQWGGKR